MGRLSIAGQARRADGARPELVQRVPVRAVQPQKRGRPPTGRDRVSGAMRDVESRLSENLTRLKERIAAAAQASGRTAGAITLVAATKYLSAEIARKVVLAGCRDLGESRPQELWSKAAALADLPVRWHFIGHLQRNKIQRTLPPLTLLHSIDSQRLLTAIDEEAVYARLECPRTAGGEHFGRSQQERFCARRVGMAIGPLAKLSSAANLRADGHGRFGGESG